MYLPAGYQLPDLTTIVDEEAKVRASLLSSDSIALYRLGARPRRSARRSAGRPSPSRKAMPRIAPGPSRHDDPPSLRESACPRVLRTVCASGGTLDRCGPSLLEHMPPQARATTKGRRRSRARVHLRHRRARGRAASRRQRSRRTRARRASRWVLITLRSVLFT